ncbi:hypothetical protein [Saccharothrix sp.]|uniref:hypothetical protein n=1 Tax=Saccharothrix sp. TaxID=1873460 RepID=UPI0028117BAB|nr:hypothetical protein [Saccharothrix sp.]
MNAEDALHEQVMQANARLGAGRRDEAERLLSRTGGSPDDRAWALLTMQATDPTYTARPFADPVNWASFAVFGAGT